MLQRQTLTADLCVVGGGMAGICAAVAAAREGARVVLMQERPVLGGNASSEIRMWICGAHGENNRETGILEEIALETLSREEQLVLQQFYIQRERGHMDRLCRELGVEEASVYRLKNRALEKFTMALYGPEEGGLPS